MYKGRPKIQLRNTFIALGTLSIIVFVGLAIGILVSVKVLQPESVF
jgi:hypothetical protein